MNEVNYEYLKEQLKNTGFGDTLHTELANKIKEASPKFQLSLNKTFGKDTLTATLDFKKSADSDMYFFNRYHLSLTDGKHEEAAKQTFYINKGSSITLKEGYNLLAGRAVHKTLTSKENEKYGAWVQLHFRNTTQNGNYEMKQFHQNYGYDLEKMLAKYPIKELGDEQTKKQLLSSLERGNLQAALFQIGGKEEKLFITANPEYKTLTAYNTMGQRVSLKDLFQKEEQSSKQEQKPVQEIKQEEKVKRDVKQMTEKSAPKKSRKQKI